MKGRFIIIALISLCLGATNVSIASRDYLDQFNATYRTSGTVLNTCILCHGPSTLSSRPIHKAVY